MKRINTDVLMLMGGIVEATTRPSMSCTTCDRSIVTVVGFGVCLWFGSLSGSVRGSAHLEDDDDDVIGGDEKREYAYFIDGLTQDIDGDDVITTTHYGRLRGKRRPGHPNIGG